MHGAALALAILSVARGASADDLEVLASEARVGELCRALQPVERQTFKGPGAAAKAKAKADYQKTQDQLKRRQFLLELTWGGFTVAEYDDAEKVVTLSTERPFRAFHGALALFDAGREDLLLDAVESELDALKAGLAKGTLSLVLLFKAAEEEGAPCVVSKAKSYAFAIDLLGVELRAGGKTVAQSTRDDLQPVPSSQGTPSVEVRSAVGSGCAECSTEVIDAVGKLQPDLAKCYEAALARKATLDGSYVFDVSSGSEGELAVGAVIADSVVDEELLACSKAAIAKGAAVKKGARAQVLVDFSRK